MSGCCKTSLQCWSLRQRNTRESGGSEDCLLAKKSKMEPKMSYAMTKTPWGKTVDVTKICSACQTPKSIVDSFTKKFTSRKPMLSAETDCIVRQTLCHYCVCLKFQPRWGAWAVIREPSWWRTRKQKTSKSTVIEGRGRKSTYSKIKKNSGKRV